MSTAFWLDRSLKSKNTDTKTYDVVIVGAGISGVSTAYWLKQEDPSLKIAIIEKSRLGFGATGRNAGFITCGSVEHFNRLCHKHGEKEALEIWRFSETNLNLLKEHIIQGEASAIGFNQNGTFSLATTEAEWQELKNVAELMNRLDIKVETLDQAQIEKRQGVVGFLGGIKYLDDAYVHPIKLLELMVKKTNVDIYESTEMNVIEAPTPDTRIVKTDKFNFETSMVILALNGYSATATPFFADKIFPTRGQILVTEPVAPFMEGPCYANFYLDYFRQLDSGHMIIGGFRQLEKETEVGYSDHTTEKIQATLEEFVRKHVPAVKDKKVTHRWAGIMGFSVDGQPMIGSLPDDQQVFFLGGYTGHGLGLAFHTAKCLTDMIFGREVPKFISAKRF